MATRACHQHLVGRTNGLKQLKRHVSMEELVIPLNEEMNGATQSLGIKAESLNRWANESHEAKDCSANPRFGRHQGKAKNRAHGNTPVTNWTVGNIGQFQQGVQDTPPVSHHVIGHERIIGPDLAEFQKGQGPLGNTIKTPIAMDGAVNGTSTEAMAHKLASEGGHVAFAL
jgi:hypothetical protein